ncbi:MAG TPA: Ig-like domain-containing protein, partial [Candidatus Dorea gallistercoris]|nr:Ig-like domain-containing protein [Candidatus Dorea gallistercoris]
NEGTVTNSGTLTNHGTINNSGTLPDNIRGTAPPSITTTSLDVGTVGTAYRATLNTDGKPASWKVTDGSLPAGLTLAENTGLISGTPTAQSTSNFTVTAANNGGSDSEQLSITISPAANVPVESVSLSQTELRLIEGDTGALTATVEPDNATNQNVTWSSDNPNVATVNNGVVTAVAAGTATITITTEDGDKTSTCAVPVVHGSLTHTPGNAATCTKEGNEEYWTCETCGKHFSDAGGNTEITLAQTVIPATGHSYENGRCRVCNAPEPGFNPAIIDGAGGTWQKGTEDGLSFTSNAAFTDFVKVQVDGRDLAASDYEVREGSTVVTLKASYLETLSVGKHTLVIVSNTGTATTEFTIQAASAADGDTPSPQTSDNNHVALWIVLLLISVASLSATASYRRKRHASH